MMLRPPAHDAANTAAGARAELVAGSIGGPSARLDATPASGPEVRSAMWASATDKAPRGLIEGIALRRLVNPVAAWFAADERLQRIVGAAARTAAARTAAARAAAARWLAERTVRERWLLVAMATLLAAGTADGLVWHPLAAARAAAAADSDRSDRTVAALRAAGPAAARIAAARIGPLAANITARAARAGLVVARIAPQGGPARATVVVTFDSVGFDALADWLAALDRDVGVDAVALKVERRSDPGTVSAELTLAER